MGVPVLTKVDRPSVGRFGVCILNAMGLVEWVAKDEESYIKKAVELSTDLVRLSALRSELRGRMESCDLMNFEGMSRKLEAGYREMVNQTQRIAQ
jgi:predicted O-linked N-acetylglucosamine transferase (SPINDLY family)